MVKPVLKEANYSDDDVWEPSLRKEKPPVPAPKPSRHSTNKKVFYFFLFYSPFYFLKQKCCFRKKQRDDTVPRRLLGSIAAERELLRRQIQEVKAKWKNLRLGINKRYRAEAYDFLKCGFYCLLSTRFQIIHCYGPQCINASRPGSKYCSDQCGLKLATTRIYQVSHFNSL